LRIIYHTLGWPNNYHLYYRNDGFHDQNPPGNSSTDQLKYTEEAPLSSTVLWRPFLYDELDGLPKLYAELANASTRVVTDHAAGEPEAKLPAELINATAPFYTGVDVATLRESAMPPQVAFLRHIGQAGWPQDFMKVFGFPEAHGDDLIGWTFLAPVPRPYVFVAIVEEVGSPGNPLVINGMKVASDARPGLRATEFGARGLPITDLPWVASPVQPGERIVVPLRLELVPSFKVGRDDAPDDLSPAPKASLEYNKRLSTLGLAEKIEWNNISKTVRSMSTDRFPERPHSYTLGPAFIPVSVNIAGQDIPLSQFNPAVMLLIGTFEGGSCPILYAKVASTGRDTRLRPALMSAPSARKTMTDWVTLEGASEIALREEEPELTHLKEFIVRGENGRTIREYKNILLRPGEEIRVKLPSNRDGQRVRMSLTGYYERLGVTSLGAP
jgi:hypothetical protein